MTAEKFDYVSRRKAVLILGKHEFVEMPGQLVVVVFGRITAISRPGLYGPTFPKELIEAIHFPCCPSTPEKITCFRLLEVECGFFNNKSGMSIAT